MKRRKRNESTQVKSNETLVKLDRNIHILDGVTQQGLLLLFVKLNFDYRNQSLMEFA